MQRIRRVRENGSGVQDAPFDLFEEERPAVRGHGVRRDGSDFPAWNAEDLFREEGSSPAGRHADPGDGYGDDAYEPGDDYDPDEDLPGDEDAEDDVHPWAFDDGEDDDDPAPARKPQHRGADAVRIGSGILLAAASAASTRLVLSGTLTPLLAVLESEDLARHLSAMVLMAVEGLPILLGLCTSLAGLALANRPRLAALLPPLGRATAFFSALPVVVRTLADGFSLSSVWTYLLLFAAAVCFLIPVRILRRGR